jgi:hypothetical protein
MPKKKSSDRKERIKLERSIQNTERINKRFILIAQRLKFVLYRMALEDILENNFPNVIINPNEMSASISELPITEHQKENFHALNTLGNIGCHKKSFDDWVKGKWGKQHAVDKANEATKELNIQMNQYGMIELESLIG